MKSILFIVTLLFTTYLSAQELNCQVNVQSNPALDISTTEKEILSELEQAVFEIMNNTSWTKDEFARSEEHTSELQSRPHLVCRLLLEKKKKKKKKKSKKKKKKKIKNKKQKNK